MMTKRNLFSFLLWQGLCWCILSVGYFYVNGSFASGRGLLFSLLFLIGHIFLFVWLLGFLCLVAGLISPRVRQLACIVGGSLFSALLVVDLLVFTQYRFHLDLAMLSMFFGSAGREIFAFPASMWFLVILAAGIILVAQAGLVWWSKRFSPSNKQIFLLAGIWLGCFMAYNVWYAWGQFVLAPEIVSQRNILPLAQPLSANRQLDKWGFSPKENPYATLSNGALQYPLAPLTCPVNIKPKNVLIFMIDAWRADMLNPDVMPQLSYWLQRPGMHQFTNHLSGGNATTGGMFSFFYALPHSYWDDFTAQQLSPLLISRALELGYEPGIFASSKLTSPAFHRNVFAHIPNLRIGSAGDSSWERDVNAVQDFEHFLDTRDTQRPFFGFIFLDAPHAYSYPPQARVFTPAKEMNYLLLTNNTDPTPYFNQYKNAVYFDDQLVAQTLNALQAHNLLENTFIVITGDHGQELNDSHQNFWGHNSNFTDYQTKVPLIVYDASQPNAERHDYRTTHYDIAPTVLQNIYGCTNPPSDYALGHNLFDPVPRPFTIFAGYTEKAVRVGDDILVLNKFGVVKNYDAQLKPLSHPLDTQSIKKGLKAFRYFYK